MDTYHTKALAELERVGLHVHRSGEPESHDHLGRDHRGRASVTVYPQAHGNSMSVVVNGVTADRVMPLAPFMAAALVEELDDRAHLHASPRMKLMLERLFLRLSDVAVDKDLVHLIAGPIAISEAGYCIDGADLTYEHHPRAHGIEYHFRQGRDHVLQWRRHERS